MSFKYKNIGTLWKLLYTFYIFDNQENFIETYWEQQHSTEEADKTAKTIQHKTKTIPYQNSPHLNKMVNN